MQKKEFEDFSDRFAVFFSHRESDEIFFPNELDVTRRWMK